MANFCSTSFNPETRNVEFKFDGSPETLTLAIDDLDEDISERCLILGITDKVRYSFAGAAGDTSYAITQANATIANLLNSQWKLNRGRSETSRTASDLAQAISQIKQIPADQAAEALSHISKAQISELLENTAVSLTLKSIRAERRAAKLREKVEDIELPELPI